MVERFAQSPVNPIIFHMRRGDLTWKTPAAV
jgi:hypothetical protein